MAARLRSNFNSGTITDNPLLVAGTTINSAGFADLPAVTGGDYLFLVLDPDGLGAGPEIVKVTAHTASATSVTVVRAAEDGTDYPAAEHVSGTPWVHAPVAGDWAEASTSLAGLMSAADKTKLDGVEAAATADQSAAEILTAVKTVDGAGSGLDADLLDGQEASAFAAASTLSAHIGAGGTAHANASGSAAGFMTAAQYTKLAGIEAAATADMSAAEIVAAIKSTMPGLLLAGGNSGLTAGLAALDGGWGNMMTTTVTLPYADENAVVTVHGIMVVDAVAAGVGLGLRLRTPEVGTEEADELWDYSHGITDPTHVHDTTAAGVLGISGSTGEAVSHDHTDGTLYTHSHDHGDTAGASTGITVDAATYRVVQVHQVWSMQVTGTQFAIQLDAKRLSAGAQTPMVAIQYTVHRAWS